MSNASEAAVEALATFLIERDWPSMQRVSPTTRWRYGCRAAAILNGEPWAIRETWPEAVSVLRGESR